MQIKNIYVNFLKKPWVIGFVRVIILAACGYFIFSKVANRSISLENISLPENFYSVLLIVVLLMPLNWFLEAYRWKLSISEFEEIDIKASIKTILSGLALNWVLPFTSGDLIARVSNQKDKYQTTSAAVLNRALMMTFTLFFGIYGVSFLAEDVVLSTWFIAPLLVFLLMIAWFSRKLVDRFSVYFSKLSKQSIFQLVSLSLIRYLIFVLQFFLILHSFLPELSFELLLAGIGCIFFTRSIFPLFFGGVGVREASGIFFFENHVNDLMLVLSPIFIIWIINIVLPSIAGLIILAQLKSYSNTFKVSDGVVE